MQRKFLLLFVAIILVFVGLVFYTKSNANNDSLEQATSPIAEDRKVYLGAWVGGFWDNETKKLDKQKAIEFEQLIAKKLAIVNIYSEWEYLSDPSLIMDLNEIRAEGWVPQISSNPYFFDDCQDTGKPLYQTIAEGKCDEFIRKAAHNLRNYDKPVILRFAWEMNLPDMYWSVQKTNSTPEDFIASWRRIYTIIKQEKADNVIMNLSFNTSHPGTIPYAQLYPGDDFVDWVSIDGYNWGNSHDWSGWASFEGVFRKSYDELTAITTKPVMISEVNSAETDGDKAKWLKDMLEVQIPYHFPKVRAVMFFNENKTGGEKVDWRIEKSDKNIQAVRDGLNNEIYKSYFP